MTFTERLYAGILKIEIELDDLKSEGLETVQGMNERVATALDYLEIRDERRMSQV